MKPEKIDFYVYAETPAEAAVLRAALYDFVTEQYDRGVLVTAERLADLLRRYGRSPIISQFLRNG